MDEQKGFDINSRSTLIAAIYLGVVGPAVFIVQPGFVQGLVEYYGFDEQEAGYIASVEMWGIAITTLVMSFLSSHFNWRTLLISAAVLVAAGNFLSLTTDSAAAFALARGITGLASGVLVSLSFTIVGLTRNTDRNFGFMIMWVLIYGAAGFVLMPTAYNLVGMNGVLIFFGLFALTTIPFVQYLPTSGDDHVEIDPEARDLSVTLKTLGVATMFIYFVAQGVIWAYYFLIGTNAGLSEQEVANGLTISQFFGVAGALIAALSGARFGRISPLTLGILGSVASLAVLFDDITVLVYAFSVCLFNFVWNMTHPFLLAAMASFDQSGRLVVHAVAGQMLGLAIGPALAASIISPGDYSSVIWLGMGLFTVSLLTILPPLINQRAHH